MSENKSLLNGFTSLPMMDNTEVLISSAATL